MFFWPGEAGSYRSGRRKIRQSYPAVPVVFSRGEGAALTGSLRRIAWTLYGPGGGKPLVVTADEAVAVAAADEGFVVRCISQRSGRAGRGERLTYYDSLEQLTSGLDGPDGAQPDQAAPAY